ncbi:MAG: DMT family transporter [Proteobacteria bacterium]|nr:DMT family transporter [Pseudomonadota bacterium]
MSGFILLAVFNGFLVGTSRAINSRLSINVGPFKASFWNHIIGFLFLALLLIVCKDLKFNMTTHIPVYTYLGGFFGALFVAVNSYVFSKIGAVKTILLVISGQMISSVLLDHKGESLISITCQFIGIAFILLGIYLAKSFAKRHEIKTERTV